jgi:energy-converting hydrogenase A subunit B
MNEILGIIIASIIAWLNFVLIDTYLGLPEVPGVKGAEIVGRDIKKRGGDLAGGFFQGNILCSPDASAGTLLASIGVMLIGIEGGIIAAFFVYIGNRLCADPGYAGTVGAITTTAIICLCSFIGLTPEMFVVGMIIAILTIQGLHHPSSSRLLGKIAKSMGRYTKLE